MIPPENKIEHRCNHFTISAGFLLQRNKKTLPEMGRVNGKRKRSAYFYITARGLKPEFELMQDFHIRRTKWILVDLVDGNPPKVDMLKQLWLSRYNR